ncbi:hypothetical protein PCE1_000779 [Barthelona sp. PCE]
MPAMGKVGKGDPDLKKKSKKGKKKGKKDKSQKKIEEELQQRELIREQLQIKYKREKNLTKINDSTIMQQWREIMQTRRVEEVKNEIGILAANHERQVDRKDNVLKLLTQELASSEEISSLAQTNHLQNIDSLIDLHKQTVQQLSNEFHAQVLGLKKQNFSEMKDAEERFNTIRKEFEDLLKSMELRFNIEGEKAREDFEVKYQGLRDKHLENFNLLKLMLDQALEDMFTHADRNFKNYYQRNDDNRIDFERLRRKDMINKRDITLQKEKIEKLQRQINQQKTKLQNSQNDFTEKSRAIGEEQRVIKKHLNNLDSELANYTTMQNRRVVNMITSAERANMRIDDALVLGESLLKLCHLNSKYETEAEKVTPFYRSLVDSDEDMKREVEQRLSDFKNEVPELDNLHFFSKKISKVTLDRLLLENEYNKMLDENQQLKYVLQNFVDGLSVNDRVLSNENPLFVVKPHPM